MPELPTGYLNFLFTDIEGSTRRWLDDAEEMAAALAAHDEVLASAIAEVGGHMVKHTGDGVLAVFEEPRAAVVAALNGQRRLELPVRMGVHSGRAELRGGDYFGPCVNRAARLMGVAHGRQVLVSQDTAALIAGVELRDLGLHHLRDMPAPETIFQLVAPGLQRDFPPISAAVRVESNLPEALTPLIGRSSEVERVQQALEAHRLVALLGPGGAGKTRLAVETARAGIDRYSGGVHLVELADEHDAARLVEVITRSIGLRQDTGSGADAFAELVTHLRPRTSLLVVDNCEHVVADVGLVIERLLRSCPDLRVLATSREVLGVEGETVYQVPPLPTIHAIELFAARASSVRPGFVVDGHRDVVRTICERLDGLPLAIELAAAQMAGMTPDRVLARLDHALEMSGRRRSTVDRHRTLRTAISWSYESLDRAEQALFRALAVFHGGFTLEAAEEVCAGETGGAGGDREVFDVLMGLVWKSLLVLDDKEGRYRMLETVHQFAAEELEQAGDGPRLRDRHAAYCTARARAFGAIVYSGDGLADPAELGNLRAAARRLMDAGRSQDLLQLVVAADTYWSHVGATDDVTQWTAAALAAGSEIPVDLQVQALATVATGAILRRPADGAAIEFARRAVELALSPEATDDARFLAAYNLGYAYVQADATDPRGMEWLRRSLTYAEHNPMHVMRACSRMSVAAFIGMNPSEGLEPAERAVALAVQLGAASYEKVGRGFRAATRAVLGDHAGACEDLAHLEDLPPELDPVWRSSVHIPAAHAYMAMGEQSRAVDHVVAVLNISAADVGEVISTLTASTACALEELNPELVGFGIGAIGRYHSATQPLLATLLTVARERALAEIGGDRFEAAVGAGRRATLDEAQHRMFRSLRGLDAGKVLADAL